MKASIFYIIFICLLLENLTLHAGFYPADNSTLNYRIIGFVVSDTFPGSSRILEIAVGNHASVDSFKKHVILTAAVVGNKAIAEVPAFGSAYTWRVAPADGKSESLHHFFTSDSLSVQDISARINVIKNEGKNAGNYLFVDGCKALYDMQGKAVWVMPHVEGITRLNAAVRDLKYSNGSITFLTGDIISQDAYNISYSGVVVWKAPNTGMVNHDSREHYHHELSRLNNGHYMVLGSEYVPITIPGHGQQNADGTFVAQPIPFGTLIEYDSLGNVIWQWHSYAYFTKSDLIHRDLDRGMAESELHDNSFYFDESAREIYVGFKNISRIVKLSYPTGDVLNEYGQKYVPGQAKRTECRFCGQHSVRKSVDGLLYMFNNNGCVAGALPTLILAKETGEAAGLKTIWEYSCTVDGLLNSTDIGNDFQHGGSVYEMSDHSLLACIPGRNSCLFIVDTAKHVTWSAFVEVWDKERNQKMPGAHYRASVITRAELEALIWADYKKSETRKR